MPYPKAYIDFLVHFHSDRDYFECHEILEEYWKEVDPGNKHSIWVGLIQLAVGNYHYRRGNFSGALRMIQKSLDIFTANGSNLVLLGLDHPLFINKMNTLLAHIEDHQEYESIDLPIVSIELMDQCLKRCRELGFEWGRISDLTNAELIHRHKVRDRTDVITERNKAFIKKRPKEANYKTKK